MGRWASGAWSFPKLVTLRKVDLPDMQFNNLKTDLARPKNRYLEMPEKSRGTAQPFGEIHSKNGQSNTWNSTGY